MNYLQQNFFFGDHFLGLDENKSFLMSITELLPSERFNSPLI